MYPNISELIDLYELMPQGVTLCTVIFDGNEVVDLVYDHANPAFYTLTDLHDVIGKRMSDVIPNITEVHPNLLPAYSSIMRTGNPVYFEIHIKSLNLWLLVFSARTQTGKLLAVFEKIDDRKAMEAQLETRIELAETIKSFRAKVAEL